MLVSKGFAKNQAQKGREVYSVNPLYSTDEPNPSCRLRSTLALLVARLGRADHPHDAFASHDLAVAAHFSDRCSDLHFQYLV
jgi:hypothetical protein